MASATDISFKVLGSLALLYILAHLLKLLLFMHIYLRPSSISTYHHHSLLTSSPPWALITGSTDGIGLGFAHELARHGFNIVLHGRNPSKLQSVLHTLEIAYPHTSFRTILFDASSSGPEATERMQIVVEELQDIHLTILINNVGSGSKPTPTSPIISPLTLDTPNDIEFLINVNLRFPAQFTRAVLPLLLSHGGPALILTMGSMSDFGMPFMSIYSASKSFDLAFSRALRREMRAEGLKQVEVLGIMTAAVTDVGWDRSKGSLFRPNSRAFARAAVGRVGCGREVVAAWWSHGVVWWGMECLPRWVLDWALVWGIGRARVEMEMGK